MGVIRNIGQVLTWSCWPAGNGVTWEVVEGTDQYTLTREQIEQKAEKKERTLEYKITRACSGALFPLTRGVSVCCNTPCTDEPRIALAVGDLVRVTRWKEHWMYGEKVQEQKVRLVMKVAMIIVFCTGEGERMATQALCCPERLEEDGVERTT